MGWLNLISEVSFSQLKTYSITDTQINRHYYSVTTGLVKDSHRIELRYGKVRAGLFCVGGVCREVPASNGFSINFTYSF